MSQLMRYKHLFALLLIILFAGILRLYRLDSLPPALYWDEVSLGYNALSIQETLRDEYGNYLPFSIRSFDDYKPPLYVYLTAVVFAVFGVSEFNVRLVSALAGILAVALIYSLTKIIAAKHPQAEVLALLSALLLAIMPWHIQFSRAAFEANLGLTLAMASTLCYLLWLRSVKPVYQLLMAAAGLSAISLYAYHSVRLVLPLILLGISLSHLGKLTKYKLQLSASILVGLVLVAPLLYISLRGSATARLGTVGLFSNPGAFSYEREKIERMGLYQERSGQIWGNLYSYKLNQINLYLRSYLSHYNINFLFLKGDGNGRHSAEGVGLTYLYLLPLMAYGVFKLSSDPKGVNRTPIFVWLAAAPAASALTADTPHAIRGLFMVIPLVWFASWGIVSFYEKLKHLPQYVRKLSIVTLLFVALVSFTYYLNMYFVVTPIVRSQDWQYGYKQLVSYLGNVERDYDEIIVTNVYDQPHIYFAFYQQLDPATYQQTGENAPRNIKNYFFRSIEPAQDFGIPNALVVVEPSKTPSGAEVIEQIHFQNGEVAFNIVRNPVAEIE